LNTYTLTLDGNSYKAQINFQPTITSGTLNATIRGVKLEKGTINDVGTTTFYGFYSNVDGFDTNWTFYNDTANDNYMGKDNSKTMWGTTNTDLQIYSDGTDGVIKFANGLRIGDGTSNYIDIQPDGEINLVGTARVLRDLWIDGSGIKAPGAKPEQKYHSDSWKHLLGVFQMRMLKQTKRA